jgi:hypothetical protein
MAFDGVDSASNVMMVEEATANIKQFMLDITGGSVEHFEMANYLCKVMSTFLFQGNMEEKCYFLLGEGRNGKVCFISHVVLIFTCIYCLHSQGTLTELLKNTLGMYFGELSINYGSSTRWVTGWPTGSA